MWTSRSQSPSQTLKRNRRNCGAVRRESSFKGWRRLISPSSHSLLSLPHSFIRDKLNTWKQKLMERTVEDQNHADWKETREPQSALNSLKHDSGRKKTFSCSECGRRFGRKTHLKTHTMTHTGEKPFSLCNKRFLLKGQLQSHMRTHTGDKPFSCLVCKKSFTQRGSLQSHMITHTREKRFSCSVCDESFLRKQHLKTHMRAHTGEGTLLYPLPGLLRCRRKFRRMHVFFTGCPSPSSFFVLAF
uniref:C2H2-type domain-containing protein n=1 Tax=Sander lucioperca TaxID=283035 RepID=A0A8C9XSZ2_SANLU